MGCLWSKKREYRVIMTGLDGAGKTTILYRLKLDKVVPTITTMGFNVEAFDYAKRELVVWDLGGSRKLRLQWPYYFFEVDLLIFVIDCNDHKRLSEAKEELWKLFQHKNLQGVPCLIMANKQDFQDAISVADLRDQLELGQFTGKWYIQGTSATHGEGLQEGLNWAMSSF